MKNSELRNAMAEDGYEMTLDELQATKKSIVLKVMPELLDTMSVDNALDFIVSRLKK